MLRQMDEDTAEKNLVEASLLVKTNKTIMMLVNTVFKIYVLIL